MKVWLQYQKKKKKKIGNDYFIFVFSQSKSEPRLFHNFAKFSEFISLSSVFSKIYHFMKWNWFFWVYYSCEFWQICRHLRELINVLHKNVFPSGWIECVVVQFYPWIKFYFLLFQTRYHTLPYIITKENKIQTKDKLNHNKCTYTCIINHYTYTFLQVDSVAPA